MYICARVYMLDLNLEVTVTVKPDKLLPTHLSLCYYILEDMEPTFMSAQICPIYLSMHILL